MYDLRVALLTTASMIGLLRDQFKQVALRMPQTDDGKFNAIFRAKLMNLGNDLLEFQSLIPVAEQMFCSTAVGEEEVAPMQTPKEKPAVLVQPPVFGEEDRFNLFLSSTETDRESGGTPPPSVDFGKAWPEEWVPESGKVTEWLPDSGKSSPVALKLSEMLPPDTSSTPPLTISQIWSSTVLSDVQRKESDVKTSKESAHDSMERKQSKRSLKSDSKNVMPADKKKGLIKFIYRCMQQKGLNDPAGHLLMDVYVEIWKEVVGAQGSCGGRVAFHRFAELLRSAPEYFELFHIGIAVDESGGACSGKQRAKMVRLVQQSEAVDGGLTPRYWA
jgi:hypothetical protein